MYEVSRPCVSLNTMSPTLASRRMLAPFHCGAHRVGQTPPQSLSPTQTATQALPVP